MSIQNGLVFTMETEQPSKMDVRIKDGKIVGIAPSINPGKNETLSGISSLRISHLHCKEVWSGAYAGALHKRPPDRRRNRQKRLSGHCRTNAGVPYQRRGGAVGF